MNKYQEALLNIQSALYIGSPNNEDENAFVCFDDIKTLDELVEKATPKKPIPLKWENNRCPNCKCYLPTKRNALKKREPRIYCDRCGQALDWGKQDG